MDVHFSELARKSAQYMAVAATVGFMGVIFAYSLRHSAVREAAVASHAERPAERRDTICIDTAKKSSFPCTVEAPSDAAVDQMALADLTAQQNMVVWAAAMAMTSLGSLSLAFLATVLLAKSFRQTAQMLAEAEKTTKAAEQTIRITQDSSVQQLRAYLVVTKCSIETREFQKDGQTGLFAACKVVYKNSGQTPASNVEVFFSCASYVVAGPKSLIQAKASENSIGAGETDDYTSEWFPLPKEALKQLQFTNIEVSGCIQYSDVFGQIRKTPFSFFCTPKRSYGVHEAKVSASVSPI